MEVEVLEAIAHGLVEGLAPLLPGRAMGVRRFVAIGAQDARRAFRMACFGAHKTDSKARRKDRLLRMGVSWQVETTGAGVPFLCVSLVGDRCWLYANPPDEEWAFEMADPAFPDDLYARVLGLGGDDG